MAPIIAAEPLASEGYLAIAALLQLAEESQATASEVLRGGLDGVFSQLSRLSYLLKGATADPLSQWLLIPEGFYATGLLVGLLVLVSGTALAVFMVASQDKTDGGDDQEEGTESQSSSESASSGEEEPGSEETEGSATPENQASPQPDPMIVSVQRQLALQQDVLRRMSLVLILYIVVLLAIVGKIFFDIL